MSMATGRRCVDLKFVVAKGGVTQTKAEREKRLAIVIPYFNGPAKDRSCRSPAVDPCCAEK